MAQRRASVGGKAGGSTRQNVRVVCRVRPQNQKELKEGGVLCLKHTDTNITVNVEESENVFSFDKIFGSDSDQLGVFNDTAGGLINDVLNGYNATIFAYGQTGTGKTHTMEGDIHSETEKGIIPRTVEALFDGVSEADENIEFTFKVSYVEIYLEKIRDLLDEHRVKVNLTIREDKIKGIYIAGVTEEYVTSSDELLGIMQLGATNRATAATGMNEGSSRSHSVFTITVSQKDIITNATKSGKLVLVDLAGSEMVRKTNATGQQLEEAKTINKSLSALGQVINALTDDKQSHVPYRDSKLTRILQDSLGGNSKTVLIVAISPSSYNAPETVSTLRFGTRAKSIENKVTVNQTRSIEELEQLLMRAEKAIDAQTAHIIALSTQLQSLQAERENEHPTEHEGTDNESEAGLEGGSERAGSSVVLKPGKMVVDIAAAEAEAAALLRLQETVQSLTLELDEERQESARKEIELKQMTILVKDKERLIQDASSILADVQRHNESLRERSELLLREKIEAVGELEGLRSQMEEEIGKSRFNLMELEVSLNTLEEENKQLKAEIAEMGGDSGSGNRGKGGNSKNYLSSAMPGDVSSAFDDELTADQLIRRMQNTRKSYAGDQDKRNSSAYDDPARVLSVKERKDLLETFSSQFASECLRYKVNEEASAALFAVLDGFSIEQEKGFIALEDRYYAVEKANGKRIRDLEDQRTKLERDLQNRIENMIQLQVKFDSLGRMDNRQLNDTIAEKDRAHLKSLQQRLEQLVAVHRQLLRKFASLELENVELKKKTQLRDERIRQLEGNSKGLIGNIRQQAERHVAELTNLREQIQSLKQEHEQRMETYKQQQMDSNSSVRISPRQNSSQNRMAPKSLRGGGGASKSFYDKSFYNMDVNAMAAAGATSPDSPPAYDAAVRGTAPPNATAMGVAQAVPYSGQSGSGATPRTSVLSRFLGK